MRAAVIVDEGGKRKVAVREVARPSPGAGELLVQVRAAAMNRADLNAAAALNPGEIAGREFAGEVVAIGQGVRAFGAGDRVMAYGAAAFAEYTRLDARLAMRAPRELAWEQAAASPLGMQTMHDALVTKGRLAAGDTVLVQGAASGMGILGVQIAKALGARLVIGTSRSDAKLQALAKYGLDAGVDISQADWVEQLQRIAGERGVDVTLDLVCGDTVAGSMAAAAVGGRIVNIGRLGGGSAPFSFELHALKRLSYIGVTFRTRSADEIAAIIGAAARDLGALVASGALGIPLDRVLPLAQVSETYAYMQSNTHFGKIVLKP